MALRRLILVLATKALANSRALHEATPTVHCVALVTPNTYEPHMLAGQFRLKAGIFECDSFDIYSNASAWELFKDHVDVASQLADKVHNIGIPLFAPMVAGPPGWDKSDKKDKGEKGAKHLANTPIFETLWKRVCAIGRFRDSDYTAKVDVDTVLLPSRISGFLQGRHPRAEFFYNTKNDMYGNFLHGPIELLSTGAMSVLCKRAEACKKSISQAAYGEDFYLNECLRHLGVPAVKGMNLLYDMYTYGAWAQKKCTPLVADKMVSKRAVGYAAYHPYKNLHDWINCRKQTRVGKVLTPTEVREAEREVKLREPSIAKAMAAKEAAEQVGGEAFEMVQRAPDDHAQYRNEVFLTRHSPTVQWNSMAKAESFHSYGQQTPGTVFSNEAEVPSKRFPLLHEKSVTLGGAVVLCSAVLVVLFGFRGLNSRWRECEPEMSERRVPLPTREIALSPRLDDMPFIPMD